MADLAKQFSREEIELALDYIIENGVELTPSTKYDLIYRDKKFPPKEVVRCAARLKKLSNWESYYLSGGDNTNLPLQELGFTIVKRSIDGITLITTSLENILKKLSHRLLPYFEVLDYLVDELGLERGSEKFYFHYKNAALIFNIGSLYVWNVNTKHYEYLSIKAEGDITKDYKSTRKGEEVFNNKVAEIKSVNVLKQNILEAAQLELAVTKSSSRVEANKADFEELVFNKEYRDEVFTELGIIGNQDKKEIGLLDTKNMKHPLNQILYGPPGTGKTYHTINKALAIVAPDFDLSQEREVVKKEFDKYLENGQIVFTTFHQSMTYEDFVEGIKPLEPKATDSYLSYDVQAGLFKQICTVAESNLESAGKDNIGKPIFEDAFEQLKLDWEDDKEMKFSLKREGYEYEIIGFTNTSIQFKKASGGTGHTMSIKTLKDLYYGRRTFDLSSGIGIYYPSILSKLSTFNSNLSLGSEGIQAKRFVIIIDEINRGNVSAIFGELITLIEESKRLGNEEALEVTLPYSKKKFGVPNNLHIIGTMNTADRSVEALDTALRRRFTFEEMMSNYDVIKSEGSLGVDLSEVLKTINDRIEVLLDRDHLIGHSYFLHVDSLETLQSRFKDNIIPLLQEYFYGDYGKIGLVLGDGFVTKKEGDKVVFASFDYDSDMYSEKSIYTLKSKWEEGEFREAIGKLLRN